MMRGAWAFRPVLLGLVLAAALGALSAGTAWGADLTVGSGGYASIQAAVDAASPGDRVLVQAGTWRGQVQIDKDLRLLGVGAERTTILPDRDVTNADNALILVNGPVSVEVSGFTVDGDAPHYQVEGGIAYLWGARGSIHDNVVRNIHFGTYGQGIRLQYASPEVYANTVTDIAETGICVARAPEGAGSDTIRVRDNVISGPLQYAITIFDTATISGNTVSNTEKDGIRIDQYDASSLSDRVILRGNTLSYTKFAGIQIGGSSGHLIEGNYLDHTNYYGFDGTGDWDYGSIKLELDSPGNDIIGNHLSDGIIAIHTWADNTYIARNFISDYGRSYPASKLDLASMRIFRNAAIMVGNNYLPWVYDPVGVVVEENVLDRDAWGLFHSDTLRNLVHAERNWWGSPNGPADAGGTMEVPTAPIPSLADMANRVPADALGAAVDEGVSYFPWYLDAERTELVEATAPPSTTTTTLPPTTTTTLAPTTFTDVPNWHPYYLQINDLATRQIVTGFGNGRFGPDDWVKRQQFAKMIVLSMGYAVTEADVCSFTDVDRPSSNLYPDNYVAVAAARGITLGVTPGTFGPWNDISRAQLITMVARAAGVGDPPVEYVPPFGNFSPTHFPWARRAAFAGLLGGLQGIGPAYDFWVPATRGEVCLVLYNLLHR